MSMYIKQEQIQYFQKEKNKKLRKNPGNKKNILAIKNSTEELEDKIEETLKWQNKQIKTWKMKTQKHRGSLKKGVEGGKEILSKT